MFPAHLKVILLFLPLQLCKSYSGDWAWHFKVKKSFPTFELNTEKHIDTITLSDSDESDVCDLKYLPPKNKKLAKVKNNKNRLTTVQNTEICDISNDECSEYEKENILNSVHGDIDNELGYSDEKEIAFRKKIRSLPLF